jgi:TPR repeat protein
MTGVDGAVVDQARGFALIHSAAQAGLPEAEYETARAYQNGWGVAANSSRMQYWLTLAYNAHLPAAEQMQEQIWLAPLLASARAGDVHSQCALGCCYLNGRFHHQAIPPHPRQAVRWFRKAAIAGNSGAECNLGYCYQNGLGVASTNYAKALHWYEAAIKLGNVDAENNIGTMYQSGEGLPQDDNKAIYWYSTAARGGNITARNNIREMMRAAIRANPTQPLTQQQREWIQGAIGVQIYEQYQQQMEAEEAQQQADAAADNASPPDPDEITPDDEIMPDDEGPGP